ncbi:helix-turn-helix domain-containing protein [Butyrivibrio sp. MC2021]|uniref:helix-turn-helix domain-containing protein n=1 Tax=Butyrivibrio sp. MC2021 TaxID=1408306 RepID=UPI00047A927A|nr:helix-turn-helix domain-containing protein [Butyrivibrio sp. MC2021]
MKPREVTEMLGIDRDRIKYFKKMGVFHPTNCASKEVADYTEADVEELRKLVVLTKAGLTCGDVKKIQEGEWSVEKAIVERRKLIIEEMKRMKGSLHLSEELIADGIEYESMETKHYLDAIKHREADGDLFMEEYMDTSPISLFRDIECPYCNETIDIDLEEYLWNETSNPSMRDDDMGPDIVYSFDSEDNVSCPYCCKKIRVSGWIREYPIGGFDSESIEVKQC